MRKKNMNKFTIIFKNILLVAEEEGRERARI